MSEITIGGLSSLAIEEVRSLLGENLPKIKQSLPVFMAIELINLIALSTGQTAVKLGVPVLVSAIKASTPADAFGLSLPIATLQRRHRRGVRRDLDRTSHKLPIKWGGVGLMMVSVWLLGTTEPSGFR